LADTESKYRPAWWLRGAHAQTMWGKFMRRYPRLPLTRETFTAPDGEELELYSLTGKVGSPRVLLLHGLEGSPRSHYVGGLLQQAYLRGWPASLLVFRGCGSTPNHARRFYHSGETTDIAATFRFLAERNPEAEWMLIGVSLGGNVLLKWLGESAEQVDSRIRAAAAISTPYDLEAGARYIASGRLRVYDRSFLRSLRRKALDKLQRYPDLFDRDGLVRARSVFDFDDVVTGPVHGFRSATDYYRQSSSEQFLPRIHVPTLLLSAADDPFAPREVWERVRRAMAHHRFVSTEFSRRGGHVGFVSGRWPWRARYYAESRVYEFFAGVLKRREDPGYD
jgi:predicted alpha/beta-fold hydrolase